MAKLTFWRRAFTRMAGVAGMSGEAWFLSYGLLGQTQNGLVPILLPLAAERGASAGLGYAAFALSGLFAPVLGGWADRLGRHRDLAVCGSASAALCLLLFTVADNAMLRLVLGAGAGLGTMAATTAGNVLAVQDRPEAEWDDRVARLQRFISAGQVIGLIAAGALAGRHSTVGFLCAAAALGIGAMLAWTSAPPGQQRAPHDKPRAQPLVGGEAGVGSALAGVIFALYGFSALAAVAFVSVAAELGLTAVWLPAGRDEGGSPAP